MACSLAAMAYGWGAKLSKCTVIKEITWGVFTACSAYGVLMSSWIVTRSPTLLSMSILISLGRFESSYTSSLNVSPFIR